MNEGKKKPPQTYKAWRSGHIKQNLLYLKSNGIKTETDKICLKYEVETPSWFVASMDFRFIDDSGEFGNPPDPEQELSLLIGKIDGSTTEKITYLEAVKSECHSALHYDLGNIQFKKTNNICEEFLSFLKSETSESDSSNPFDELSDSGKTEIETIAEEEESGSLRPVDWDSIYESMAELTSEGHSAKKASEIVEKKIGGVRAAGTIRNKYKGYL